MKRQPELLRASATQEAQPIVTITRQMGAGGGELAGLLARRLGWRRIDWELVVRVARELKIDPTLVQSAGERVETFWERAGQNLGGGPASLLFWPPSPPFAPEQVFRATVRVLGEVAREGSMVIVGHGAQCVLDEHPNTLHILVHADLAFRIERARPRWGHEGAVEQRLRRSDQDRQRYIRVHFQRDWMDPRLYDLCIDSGGIGIRQAVDLVYSAVRATLR